MSLLYESDLSFSFTIRRSLRATRVRIIVTESKVEAVAPFKVPELRVRNFVDAKKDWIIQALTKIAERKRVHSSFTPSAYVDGAKIPYLGVDYSLSIQASKLQRVKIEFSDGFTAFLPHTMPVDMQCEATKTALINWMKKQALQHVQHLVDLHAAKKQLLPRSINIRTQKSRWGSCGIHNDIQINWLLVLAPIEVLEYVVVHELCHIQVKNHSIRFWELVAWHLPNFQQQRLWLKRHGSELMAGM